MCRGFLGCLLVTINVIYMFLGLAMLVAGALLVWSKDLTTAVVDKAMAHAGSRLLTEEQIRQIIEELWSMTNPMGYVLFGAGIAIFVLAILSFIGVCCGVTCILIVYAAIIGTAFLIHLLCIIIYFSNKSVFLTLLNSFSKNALLNYESIMSESPDSLTSAFLMEHAQCCGYHNGEDYHRNGSKFSNEDKVNDKVYVDLQYPVPCCKFDQAFKNAQKTCPYVFTPENSNYQKGCGNMLEADMVRASDLVMYSSLIVLIVNLLAFVFAVLIIVLRKRE